MKTNIEELESLLNELRSLLRRRQREKWDRSLPFEDELFDRWERAEFLRFGEKSSIYQSALVFGDVKVGKDTWVGPFTILDGSGGLEIGDNCSISAGVQIYTHDSVDRRLSGGKAKIARAGTRVGDSCYIGPLSVIKKGIEIGSHSVVGALSYVNKNVAPYTIAAGTPARKIGEIEVDREGTVRYLLEEKEADRIAALERELGEMKRRISEMEQRLKDVR